MKATSTIRAILAATLTATLLTAAAFGTEPTPCETAYLASGGPPLMSLEEFAALYDGNPGPC